MEKKRILGYGGVKIPVKKIVLIMQWCVIFMLGAVLQLSAAGYAQTVELKTSVSTLKAVFEEVERQTGKITLFSNNEVDMNRKVELMHGKYSIEELYRKTLEGTKLDFLIEKEYIVIRRKEETREKVLAVPQSRPLKGKVTDENGIPLPGVTVMIEGTNLGCSTDVNGEYSLMVPDVELNLIFTFIGMEDQVVKVIGKEVVDIVMHSATESLDEVIVTGYQTISKECAPGSFSVVSPADMKGKLQTNIMDRLEGLVAGLVSYKGNIQIRGISTLNGERAPLYVVDGVPYEGSLNVLNPADIVNVTVLKDATAASIYGARSANGVIVITTRRGVSGKMRVNYNGTVNFTPLPDRGYKNLMNSAELVDFQWQMFNKYHAPYESIDIKRAESPVYQGLYKHEAGELSDADLTKELDKYRQSDNYDQIRDEFLRKRKITHQHNLSVHGGSDFYQYMLSLNYQGDSPYERAQHTDRVGFNLKNSFQIADWLKADIGIIGSEVKEDYDNGIEGMDLLNGGIASYYILRDGQNNPLQLYNEKSQWELDRLTGLGLLDQSYYPANELDKTHYTNKDQYLNLNIGLNLRIIDGLSVDLRYQTEKGNTYSKQYYTKDAWYVKNMINNATEMKDDEPFYHIPLGGQLQEINGRLNSSTMRAQVNFNRTFEEIHELVVIAGAERRKVIRENSGQYKVGYDDHNLTYKHINESDLQSPVYGTEAPSGSFYYNAYRPIFTNVEDRYISFYGNGSYTFQQRLSVSASIRMDQSNLFGTDPKYQYRPLWSAGLQYVIIEDKGDWLDRLAGRVTYGINGNVSKKSGPYLIAKPWNYGSNYLINENYTYISTPPNSGLRWEKTKVTNVGLDFSFFRTRLTGSIEYYSKNTSDLLGLRDADPTIGWSSIMINYGDMRNRGMELTLHSKNIRNSDFNWTSDVVFSYNKNKITNIKSQSKSATSYLDNLQAREGYPINSLFSVRYAGLDEKGNPTAYKKNGEIVKSVTELTEEDLVYSGTYDPRYNASFTNTFSYKGIDLSFMFVYYGGHVLRDPEAGMYLAGANTAYMTNIDRDHVNYWKGPEDSKDIRMHPAHFYNAKSGMRNLWQAADIHIQKGDFIKLRDLSIGYTLPKPWIQHCCLQNVRVDFQIQNVWRWAANDKKLDPEVWSGGDVNSLSRGSLTPTTYTLGLTVNF